MFYALELQVFWVETTLAPLFKSIEELKKAAIEIHDKKKSLQGRKGWAWLRKENQNLVRELNDRLMMTERAFTDGEGLPGRLWYKHLIYAPSKYNDCGSKSFPGIDDTIEKSKSLNTADSWHSVQHQFGELQEQLHKLSLCLKDELK